jgi:glycosyltransferase involved in cell wall biosynthesis
MKVLLLSSQLPYPGTEGGVGIVKNFLEYFCTKYSLTLITLLKGVDFDYLLEFLEIYEPKLDNFLYFNIDKPRSVKNYAYSLIKNLPITIYRNYSYTAKNKIKENIAENNYDIIFCSHLLVFQYVPEEFHSKTILLEQNAEYMIWKGYSKIKNNILIKTTACFESFRMFNYEVNMCNKASVVMAAPKDIEALKPHADRTDYFTTYHLGHDKLLNRSALQNKRTNQLLFIGTMTWEPNKDGIKWFIEEIYPKIKKENPDVLLTIVGKYDDLFLDKSDDVSIKILGYVPDLEDMYKNATLFICPLRFGSGMKIKVLDAMYRGLPMITTSIGAESIDLEDGTHCFIADTPDEFAKKTLMLLGDPNLWRKFSTNSRALAARVYTWESEYKRLDAAFEKIIGNSIETDTLNS